MSVSREQLANNASSTLSAAITSTSATTLTVTSASSFPSAGNFRILIDSEIMLVTGVSGTTFTVVRGQEGTTAATHANTTPVTHLVTKASLQTYGRDNYPFWDGTAPPYRLQDASGNILTASSFTQHNVASQVGTPTVADQDQRITIGLPAGSGGPSSTEGWTVLSRPAPATPYSIVMGLVCGCCDTASKFAPVAGFRESSTGKSVVARIPFLTSGEQQLNFNTATNEGGLGFISNPANIIRGPVLWYKLTDDGTNIKIYWSMEGINWIQVYTQARTTNFTSHPDSVIWGAGSNNPPFDTYCTLVSWNEG